MARGLIDRALRMGESKQFREYQKRVEVINRHALAVEVHAVGNGIDQRLGTVHPGMSARFVIPANLTTSGGVELQVGPTASNQRFRSGELLFAPGSVVDLIVTPQLFSSTATIRP